MEALRTIHDWGAPNAAAAVVTAAAERRGEGSADHVFEWASVTKLATALAVLVAVEEGSVDLDEAAGPEGSTLRHLLAHASGLGPEPGPPLAPPGSRRIYSNHGFDMLADHVAARTGIAFARYFREVLSSRDIICELHGSAGSGARGTLDDVAKLALELLSPSLVAPETLGEATQVAFRGLDGVLPGFGRMAPNDWGLGFELRDGKSPHWTGSSNSPRTFGHFGQTGTFLWVDPDAGLALACLTDLDFGDWAKRAWPALSDAVLAEIADG